MTDLPTPTHIHRLHLIIVTLIIFVATMMTFVNSVDARFVNWDDDTYVTDNPHIQELNYENVVWILSHNYYYSWIPLTLLSHAADVAIWGMNPKGHHLTNILLHSWNAVWIFFVGISLSRISKSVAKFNIPEETTFTTAIIVGSGIAALLYATHPLRVEPVAWVSGRKDLLCVFFLLPAFWTYLRWKLCRREVWILTTHLFFALALLAKPMAAPFPIVLALIDIWWTKKRAGRVNILDCLVEGKTLLFVMSAIIAVITIVGAETGHVNVLGELSIMERILFPFYAILFYLYKIVVPFDLSPIYPDVLPAVLYLSPLVLAGVGYATIALFRTHRAGLAVAFLSFVAFIVPTFVGLSTGLQPLADRYTYISSIPFFLFIGGSVDWLWARSSVSPRNFFQREFIVVVLCIVCGLNAYRTIRHVAIWNNSVSLWSHAVRYAPSTREEFEERKPYFIPGYLDELINLGTALYADQRKTESMEVFESVLVLDSRNADAHFNLGNLRYEQGDPHASLGEFWQAIASDSSYAKAYFNIGILLTQTDSTAAAVSAFQKAARLGYADARRVLSEKSLGW